MREEKERKKKEEKKKEPTETGPFPQSYAQDVFVNRVRGNPHSDSLINKSGHDSSNMQFYVGRQLLDHISLKDALGAEDQGREPVVVKHFRFRDDGGRDDLHANRAAQNTSWDNFQDSGLHI